MTGHRLEVADIFHAHQNQFLQRWGHVVSDQQRKALRDIGRCRTAALGTHLERRDRCNYETVAYDSCRNRHCPKCQSSARDRWLMQQAASLLPVPYAHVVFTVPEQLAPLALSNQRLFYNLLAPISNKFYKRFLRGSSTKEIGADSDHDRTSVLSFTITPDGKISALHLDESSRDSGLDRAAWQSTTQAKTFPPLPKDFHGASLSLRVRYSGGRMPTKAS